MLTQNLIEKIMAEVADCTARRSRLLLTQLDMAYPPSQSRTLIRKAILNTLGDSGLLPEVRSVLIAYSTPQIGEGGER